MINHEKCIDKIRKAIMKEQTDINYIRFDLSNIVSWDENNKRSKYNKTGQRIEVGFDYKKKDGTIVKKERKSFIAHTFCPFCGKKYVD